MFYKFDEKKLLLIKNKKKIVLFWCFIFLINIGSFVAGRYAKIKPLDILEKEVFVIDCGRKEEKFTKDRFIQELKRLDVKFPHIVMAQSMIETGNWKSEIFRQNHNLFGMREAKSRVNTALGTNLNYAYYENWKDSVYDYAFYQCTYLSQIKTEEEYFSYLATAYAESPGYVSAIKSLIQKEKLREFFKPNS
jgi:hypothetical protein